MKDLKISGQDSFF